MQAMNILIKEIEPSEVKKWHDAGEIVLIDVRQLLEYNEEHIAKAQLFPSSNFKPEILPDPSGKKLLFYCQMGRRSMLAVQKWAEYSGQAEAYTLKGGIKAWKAAGCPTVADAATRHRVERQIYAHCGFLLILGIMLALFVSMWFLILPGAIAVLLLVSGFIGHSIFSFLLSLLPWNR